MVELEEDIRKELTCPMCMETFRRPKLLDCMHSFCESCIKPLIAYDTGELTCPVCRHITKTKNGTASLTMNIIAQNMIEAVDAITLGSAGGLTCNECDQDIAVNFCCDCYQRLCHVCTEYHKRSLKFKGHNMQLLEAVSRNEMSQGRIKQCSEHNEVIKFYCNDCSFTICHDCSVSKKHNGHSFDLLEEIASDNKKSLILLVQNTERKRKAVNKSIKEAENTMQVIEKTKEMSMVLLEDTFNKLHELLVNKKNVLVKAINQKYNEGVTSINKAKENSQSLEAWVTFTNAIISNRCNAEIMDTFTNLKRQLADISVMSFMKPRSILEAEEAGKKKVPTVRPNPNAKSKRRLSNQSQILGLNEENEPEKPEPFSSHNTSTKRASEKKVNGFMLDRNVSDDKLNKQIASPTPDLNKKGKNSSTKRDSSKLNGHISSKSTRRMSLPSNMTPEIDVSNQSKNESWNFHEQKYKEETRNRPRHLKKVPPPRPPPAKVNSLKQISKRRQSIPSKPTSPPPNPPENSHFPPFSRSKSQPQIRIIPKSRRQSQRSKKVKQPPRTPPPPPTITSPPTTTVPPLITTPPPIKTLLHHSSSFNISDIQFPVPPSSPPSENGDDTSGYTSNSDVSNQLEDDRRPVTTIESRNEENCGKEKETDSSEMDENLAQTKIPPVPPSPAPRFFAGITMVKRDIIVNEDVVKLLMETINDSCLISSDQNPNTAYCDAMFSSKDEIFQQ